MAKAAAKEKADDEYAAQLSIGMDQDADAKLADNLSKAVYFVRVLSRDLEAKPPTCTVKYAGWGSHYTIPLTNVWDTFADCKKDLAKGKVRSCLISIRLIRQNPILEL
jgi:hypothetical protein